MGAQDAGTLESQVISNKLKINLKNLTCIKILLKAKGKYIYENLCELPI